MRAFDCCGFRSSDTGILAIQMRGRPMSKVTLPLQELYGTIRDDLTVVERIFDEELFSVLPCVNDLCGRVRRFRGKMLRPALLLFSGKACGRVTRTHHVLAAVVEMVHMATLVHDDVLDEAAVRRRQPTINALSGNVTAVLLGDYLISHAYHLCSSLDDQFASRLISATTNTVCEGELLQNYHRGNPRLSEAEYFEIIRRKTAVLTAACCKLGAFYAGAEPEVVRALEVYGLSTGIAFQIVDDVLDVIGNPDQVGKTLGLDFDHGKATLPAIHCLSHPDSMTGRTLISALGQGSNMPADVLRELLESTGSIDYAVSIARHHVEEAVDQLGALPPHEAKGALIALAEFIIDRRF
jgi:octaprenyl-diphosphate synthase